MGLRLFGDFSAFGDALAASSDGLYSICNRDRLHPTEVMELERRAADAGHHELSGDALVRNEAQNDIEAYFREAARADPELRFAYSSKVVLSVPEFQDLQKIFLLRRRLARQPNTEMLVLVPDARLRRLFDEIFGGAPMGGGLAVPGLRAWGRFLRTMLRTVAHVTRRAEAEVLVFTLSSGTPRIGTDAYFGKLAGRLSEKAPTLTIYLASGGQVRLPSDAATLPFEAFVSVSTVITTWLGALVSAAPALIRDVAGELAPLHRYIRRAEVRSGEYFMQRLLARGFRAMIARVSPQVIVYPFENRTWEKHLLAEAYAQGVRRVAYQHSSITPRHLAFVIGRGEIANVHLPDRVITVGLYTAGLLRGRAQPLATRIAIGASLRTSQQMVTGAITPGILVAISSNRSEALSLLQTTHVAAARVGVPFIIRTHPTIGIEDIFSLFRWPANVELSAGQSLAVDLSRVTMIAYSSSTVALEGMLYGRLPVFVDIGDCPSGDPIDGEHAFKFCAQGGAALAARMTEINELEAVELARLQSAARTFAEDYLHAATSRAVEAMAATILQW